MDDSVKSGRPKNTGPGGADIRQSNRQSPGTPSGVNSLGHTPVMQQYALKAGVSD